jgi:hypothetical protein
MGIINQDGDIVRCYEPEFNNYACMHRETVKDLSDYVRERRMSKWEFN